MVFFVNEFGLGKLSGSFNSPCNAGAMVKEFGESFGESVSEGLHHKGFVDVVFFAQFGRPFVGSVDADSESSKVIIFWGDVVGEGVVGLVFLLVLLAEGVKGGVVLGEVDVVADGVGGEESVYSGGGESLFSDDFFEEDLSFQVEFFGDFGPFFVASF